MTDHNEKDMQHSISNPQGKTSVDDESNSAEETMTVIIWAHGMMDFSQWSHTYHFHLNVPISKVRWGILDYLHYNGWGEVDDHWKAKHKDARIRMSKLLDKLPPWQLQFIIFEAHIPRRHFFYHGDIEDNLTFIREFKAKELKGKLHDLYREAVILEEEDDLREKLSAWRNEASDRHADQKLDADSLSALREAETSGEEDGEDEEDDGSDYDVCKGGL